MQVLLNKDQEKAVNHSGTPLLVAAGPGSGKTRVIVERVKHLIEKQGIKPSQILCLTFSDKASEEMRNRIIEQANTAEVETSTFHSFCLSILEDSILETGVSFKSGLVSRNNQLVWGLKNIDNFGFEHITIGNNAVEVIESIIDGISAFRDELVTPAELKKYLIKKKSELEEIQKTIVITTNIKKAKSKKKDDENDIDDINEQIAFINRLIDLQKVYEKYELFKRKESLIDYDDMLQVVIELFRSKPDVLKLYQDKYAHVLVDEFQDNNFAQLELIKLLCPLGNVTVVGDDDQSIYRFRGAYLTVFEDFIEHYKNVTTINLERNYRSTKNIVSIAKQLLDPIPNRIKKNLHSENEDGDKTPIVRCSTDLAEIDFVVKKIKELLGREIVVGYKSKIIGEENNVKILWLACISKDLPKKYRLSTIVVSTSSAGKSNLVNNVLEPFSQDVIDYTDYTQAFLKRMNMNFDGKIFKLEQMEKTNDDKQVTLSTFKFLLSEGKLKMGLVEKDEKGKQSQKILEVNGIPVFVTTSTSYNIDPESQNRLFLQQVDEGEAQTKKVISHIFSKYATLSINDSWTNELQELKTLAFLYKKLAHRITDILIPFGKKIEDRIPTNNVTIRRDLPKILNLTCVIAFIHASNRKRIADKRGKSFIKDQFGNTESLVTYYLIATPDDFKEALAIAGSTIKQTLNKTNEVSMQVYTKVKDKIFNKKKENNIIQDTGQNTLDNIMQQDEIGVTVKEMAQELKRSGNRTRELLNQLADNGFLIRDKNHDKTITYYLTDKEFVKIDIDDVTFSDDELEQWLKDQTFQHKDILQVLGPDETLV